MKVYAVGWSDDLDDVGQWALDPRCYASQADAMKRKERIEGRGDDYIRRYAHIEELELVDSSAYVIRDEHRRACAERDALIRDLYDNLWTHVPKCAEAFAERMRDMGIDTEREGD